MLYCDAAAAQYAAHGLSNIHTAANLQPAKLATLHLHVDNIGNYPIVIVADEAMMRGVDYRSDGKGLLLVINKTFTTNRDAEQGLARVGRFGDVSLRVLVKGIELVDKIVNAEKYSTFFQIAQSAILPLRPDNRKRKHKAEGKLATAMSRHTS